MTITSQRHSLPSRSMSHDAGIYGIPSPAQRTSRSRPIKPRPSGVPAVMGPPNHASGVPVMGASGPGLHLDVMGGHDLGPRSEPMGGPDTGRRLHLLGESDAAFTDSLFGQWKSLR